MSWYLNGIVGLVGGVVGVGISSWLTEQPSILGADWWDVMTAFGTVGATIAAVGIAARAEFRAERERVWRGMSLKWFIALRLGDIQAGATVGRAELEKIVQLPAGTLVSMPLTFGLHKALPMLDLGGMIAQLDGIHSLGKDAHRFAEVFAHAEACHKELLRLLHDDFYVMEQNVYLEGLIERFTYLHKCTVEVVGILNKPL